MSDTLKTPRKGTTAETVVVLPDTVHPRGRERRPSGAPPPLPRSIGRSGRFWLGALAYVVISSAAFLTFDPWLRLGDRIDTWTLVRFASIRIVWIITVAQGIKAFGSGWTLTAIGLGMAALLMILRRWRHLLVFMVAIAVLEELGGLLYILASRPRPYGVAIIGGWGGFSLPSPPVATFSIVLVGIAYTLIPAGRARSRAKWCIGGAILIFVLSRLYLAVDHPSDAWFGVILGVAIPVMFFRLFAPNDVAPVTYGRRGSTAHLDVTGRRGEGIRRAALQQLGLNILEIKPFGLEGSGGSTPLRLRVEGDPDTYLFSKLYAKSHVRADRWYKLWRTILYGKLEDEASFQTVRRFVEYEDYTLRLVQDAGIVTAKPYGIVEITPEREYMIVMGFFDDATEIGEAEVDDRIIDQGLAMIRNLWDAGLAHRDIKPANLLVKDGRLILIDVFFVQVRPSPWRQAVDLANMMLVLAVRTDPERVYQRALAFFSPDEISEAFAATRGVASPTQLRAYMKRDGRDLLARFRALAPPRRPIAIQRWSVRRILVGLGMLLVFVFTIQIGIKAFLPAQYLEVTRPDCGTGHAVILVAQSVPSATQVPCLASLPAGWTFGGAQVHTGRATFWLNSQEAGDRAVVVSLQRSCGVSGSKQVPTDEAGASRFEKPLSLSPRFADVRTYVFPGGCAIYDLRFAPGVSSAPVFDVDAALAFQSRDTLVRFLERTEDARLCGAGVFCPG